MKFKVGNLVVPFRKGWTSMEQLMIQKICAKRSELFLEPLSSLFQSCIMCSCRKWGANW